MKKRKKRNIRELSHLLVTKRTRHGLSKREAKNHRVRVIRSIGTEEKAKYCVATFLNHRRSKGQLKSRPSASDIQQFLLEKAATLKQKTIDGYRQMLQIVFDEEVDYVKSEVATILKARAYLDEQIIYLSEMAPSALSMSLRLASAAGLRAEEILTIQRSNELRESDRPWNDDRFIGRDDHLLYVVKGKGGLVRRVSVPHQLAKELESYRMQIPVPRVDRKIHYLPRYSIPGGHKFSQNFSRLSKRALGWSVGGHGLRYRYVQNRWKFLVELGYSSKEAISIISSEIGHFDSGNTDTYMR